MTQPVEKSPLSIPRASILLQEGADAPAAGDTVTFLMEGRLLRLDDEHALVTAGAEETPAEPDATEADIRRMARTADNEGED